MALELKAEQGSLESLQHKYTVLEKEHEVLRGQYAMTKATLQSKNIGLDDARAQEKHAIERAERYKTEVDRLCGFLSSTVPPIEQSILAHFSGKIPGSLSLVDMFYSIPELKRLSAVRTLQCCIGEEKTVDFVLVILRDSLDDTHPTKEQIFHAVSKVLSNKEVVQRIADAWEEQDAQKIQDVLKDETISESPFHRALDEMFGALF